MTLDIIIEVETPGSRNDKVITWTIFWLGQTWTKFMTHFLQLTAY